MLVFALAAAVSVDVVRSGYRVKSDEATYVSMALSLAYDHDLAYERRDLERFLEDLGLQRLLAEQALQLAVAKQYPDLAFGPGYTYDKGDKGITLNLKHPDGRA